MKILCKLKDLIRQTRSSEKEAALSGDAAYATAFQKELICLSNEVYGINNTYFSDTESIFSERAEPMAKRMRRRERYKETVLKNIDYDVLIEEPRLTNALAIVIAIVSLGFFFSMGSIYSKTMTEAQIAYGKKIFAIMTVFLIVSFYTQTVNGIILACEKYTFSSAVSTNAMGISKALEERVAVAKSRITTATKICCTRYGNVMCSRGSVIPLWINQIKNGVPITITEPSMTRFIMSLDEAVDLVLFAFEHGVTGDIFVQKAPACTIETQAKAVLELFDTEHKSQIKVIGIRHGEKMYETLLTNEECAKAVDMGDFYRVPADTRDLNYDNYFSNGDKERNPLHEFDSNNTKLLTLEETKAKIASLQYIQEELAKVGK